MIRKQHMTAEELLVLPDDGQRYELVRGELRSMSPAGYRHGRIALHIAVLLYEFVKANDLGEMVAADTGFTLERNPDTVRAPDVAFVAKARVPTGEEVKRFPHLAPDLVVEVISPNDTPGDIEEKIQDYLTAGVRLIWVAYPETRSVHEFRPGQERRILTEQDTLNGADVLPDFTCPIAELF